MYISILLQYLEHLLLGRFWSLYSMDQRWTKQNRLLLQGTFDPNQPNLIGDFLQGKMNYWLNAVDFNRDFYRYTQKEQRTFIAQRLELSQDQAIELTEILKEESKPENRMFTYDWATKSCATKIRDRLNRVLDEQLLQLSRLRSKNNASRGSTIFTWKTGTLVFVGQSHILQC